MNPQIVLAYATKKLEELKTGNGYSIDFREISLPVGKTVRINATGQFYFLVDGYASTFRISSEAGVYDLSDSKLTENKHEHWGEIIIENNAGFLQHIQFVVITPLTGEADGAGLSTE